MEMVGKLCLVMDHQRPLMPKNMLVLNRYLNCLNVRGNPLSGIFFKIHGESVVVDDPLQGTICRPFPLYATFSTDMKYFGEYNWLSFLHLQYFMSVKKKWHIMEMVGKLCLAKVTTI
jgi:hypothetical protein